MAFKCHKYSLIFCHTTLLMGKPWPLVWSWRRWWSVSGAVPSFPVMGSSRIPNIQRIRGQSSWTCTTSPTRMVCVFFRRVCVFCEVLSSIPSYINTTYYWIYISKSYWNVSMIVAHAQYDIMPYIGRQQDDEGITVNCYNY